MGTIARHLTGLHQPIVFRDILRSVALWGGILLVSLSLAACGGDSYDDDNGGGGGPTAPTLSLSFGLKQLQFSWTAYSGADYYRLMEDPDGASGFSQVGGDIMTTSTNLDIAVHNHDWADAIYRVDACIGMTCYNSNVVGTTTGMLAAIGYFKASNTGAGDSLGFSASLSGDGNTLAIGGRLEDSNATGIDGTQADESAADSGAVYVFARSGSTWSQQAYVKASNTGAGDLFGTSVSLSSDGNTLAVGAEAEDSNADGINGTQADESAIDSGAVYVFTRSGVVWTQEAYVKASNSDAGDIFGNAVSLSSDGDTLAVSAEDEDSSATGINGTQADESAANSGAVYVFTRSATVWTQEAYVKASNTGAGDTFGFSVDLSGDGSTLAVGAHNEDSSATGINGTQADETAIGAGAVYVFTRSGVVWTQEAYVKASNTGAGDQFGNSVDLSSSDGNTLAVGARLEDSSATGIGGTQADETAANAGAVYVFTRSGVVWTQEAYVKASNTGTGDQFGFSASLSADGNMLAVGSLSEDSNATGIGGTQANETAAAAGAVYVFTRSGVVWTQQAYVKAPNTGAGDNFGDNSVDLSSDGSTLAVAARAEDSNATGVGGSQTDNSAAAAGAVYLY